MADRYISRAELLEALDAYKKLECWNTDVCDPDTIRRVLSVIAGVIGDMETIGPRRLSSILERDAEQDRRISEHFQTVEGRALTMRLGDLDKAEAVLRNISEHLKDSDKDDLAWAFAYAAADVIKRQPTVDAELMRHGRWDDSGRYQFPGGSVAVRCSECGCALTTSEYRLNKWNYCPVCGARMDKEAGKD